MRLYQVTVSFGGKYQIKVNAYGKTQQEASNNAIACLQNNYADTLTVTNIKEVEQNETTVQTYACGRNAG